MKILICIYEKDTDIFLYIKIIFIFVNKMTGWDIVTDASLLIFDGGHDIVLL